MNSFTKFFAGWALAVLFAIILNLALLGAAVWIVVKILQWTGVI